MATPVLELDLDENLATHDHTEADLGAILDSRYVNVTGDTMTGALVITPTANSTSILNVTNQAGTSVLNVDTTNQMVGVGMVNPAAKLDVLGAVRATQSSTGYSQFTHVNALSSSFYPRAFFNIYGNGSETNSALYVTPGSATGTTQQQVFFGLSTNVDVKQADSYQGIHYLTTSLYKITTVKAEGAANAVPIHFGGTASSSTDSKLIVSTGGDPVVSADRTITVGTSTSFITLYAVSNTLTAALFWKSDQPFRLGTATSTAGGGFSEKMRITNTGDVGIGVTPTARLHIDGSADDEQLIVDAHSTQTANLVELRNSSATKLAFFDPSGKLILTNIGASISGGQRLECIQYGNTAGDVVYVNRTLTTSASGSYSALNTLINSGNLTGTATAITGLNFQANMGTTTTTTMSAYRAILTFTGAGTCTTAHGYYFGANTNAAATITNLNGLYIDAILANANGATTTNARGIYVANVSGATNNFSILTNAGNVVFNEGGDGATDFRVESDTEANMIFLDANADTDGALYLGGTTNGIKINKGGDLTLLGTAKYERHVQIPAVADGKVANQPTAEDFFTAGGLQYASAGAEYAYCQWEIPDDWDGTDIVFEVDWFPDSGAISGTDAIRWTVEYRAIAEGELINAGTSVTLDNGAGGDTTDYAQYETKHTRFTLTYNNANQPLTAQDHVYFKISRDTSVANDFSGTVTVSAYEIIYQSKGFPTSN